MTSVAESRLFRSDHIELEMKPDGQKRQGIRTPGKAQLEFKPNAPDQSHRAFDASRLRVHYGRAAISIVSRMERSDTNRKATRQRNPQRPEASAGRLYVERSNKAKFVPATNQVAPSNRRKFSLPGRGAEGAGEQGVSRSGRNRITLMEKAEVADDSGAALADRIVMDQESGDMDATGHVVSTHAPDKNQKPGTSMLDTSQPMQASAKEMHTRGSNSQVAYRGRAVMWQGANRISADRIDVDRDEQTFSGRECGQRAGG